MPGMLLKEASPISRQQELVVELPGESPPVFPRQELDLLAWVPEEAQESAQLLALLVVRAA